MAKILEWCSCRHPRVTRGLLGLYAAALVAAIFIGGYATGSLVTWSDAGQVITQQREDYRQPVADPAYIRQHDAVGPRASHVGGEADGTSRLDDDRARVRQMDAISRHRRREPSRSEVCERDA